MAVWLVSILILLAPLVVPDCPRFKDAKSSAEKLCSVLPKHVPGR
jgi:hypothetical protein